MQFEVVPISFNSWHYDPLAGIQTVNYPEIDETNWRSFSSYSDKVKSSISNHVKGRDGERLIDEILRPLEPPYKQDALLPDKSDIDFELVNAHILVSNLNPENPIRADWVKKRVTDTFDLADKTWGIKKRIWVLPKFTGSQKLRTRLHDLDVTIIEYGEQVVSKWVYDYLRKRDATVTLEDRDAMKKIKSRILSVLLPLLGIVARTPYYSTTIHIPNTCNISKTSGLNCSKWLSQGRKPPPDNILQQSQKLQKLHLPSHGYTKLKVVSRTPGGELI